MAITTTGYHYICISCENKEIFLSKKRTLEKLQGLIDQCKPVEGTNLSPKVELIQTLLTGIGSRKTKPNAGEIIDLYRNIHIFIFYVGIYYIYFL